MARKLSVTPVDETFSLSLAWPCGAAARHPSGLVRLASTRCQVPAMAYIFGMPDRNPKMLRIRFTCNGQTTPGQQSLENGVADLRCERNADLGY